ncbi:MAG TPA: retropepsin-like aspartic protease [Chloroflexia bacterium]|jgi:predicted aspartyl protease
MLPFDPKAGLIVVPARISGPTGEIIARLAIDTGSTTSTLSRYMLISLGYNVDEVARDVRVTTASGTELAARVWLTRINVMNHKREQFSILSYTLPESTTVDGVLGLGFLQGTRLTLDFAMGWITLE